MAHITPQQRYTISCMLKNGYTKIEIAKAIDKDKTVVYRELKRNSDARSGIYKDELANRKYAKRQKNINTNGLLHLLSKILKSS